jgi:uncharacterized protein
MPLLTLAIGLTVAAPVMGLTSLVVGLVVLAMSWRHVDLGSVRRLVVGSVVGIPTGVLLLTRVPEGVLTKTLGGVLIAFGIYRLVAPQLPRIARGWAYVFGYISGCFAGAYNVGGPPVVIYGSMRGWEQQRFRGTLQGYFVTTSFVVAFAHAIGGLWSVHVWQLFALAIPGVIVATFLGERLVARFEADTFARYLSLLLIALGVSLFF